MIPVIMGRAFEEAFTPTTPTECVLALDEAETMLTEALDIGLDTTETLGEVAIVEDDEALAIVEETSATLGPRLDALSATLSGSYADHATACRSSAP